MSPFFRVITKAQIAESSFEAEWRVTDKSRYYQTPYLYKENGFKERKYAEELAAFLVNLFRQKELLRA